MLADLQGLLVDCCTAADPVAALAAARAAQPGLAEWLDTIDADGLVLTSLLVKKLRFERILRGDPKLQARFDEDPERFTEAFRDHLATHSPTSVFPQEEAACFRPHLEAGQEQRRSDSERFPRKS